MGKGGRALLLAGGVLSLAFGAVGTYVFGPALLGVENTEHATKAPPEGIRVERSDRSFPLSGTVTTDGFPLDGATLTAGGEIFTTDETGTFEFESIAAGTITVNRLGYRPLEFTFDGSVEEVDLALEPRVVRALFASWEDLTDDGEYQYLIDVANTTTVNSLVFEVKDDLNGGWVYYDTQVQAAIDSGSVKVKYDIEERLDQAQDAGLYVVARIPAFASRTYTQAYPEHKITSGFLDPRNRDAWEYPLDLAVEVCGMGFDEIQFDYVRFPESYPYSAAPTQAERVGHIRGFLEEAASRLHPMGCVLAADMFGWVQVSTGDGGIGQLLEEVTKPIDVNSPMIYPKTQWGDLGSTIGINNPAANPGDTVGAVLDMAAPRVDPGTIVRPWVEAQGSISSAAVRAQIDAAEDRGLGWMLWDFIGSLHYVDVLPAGTTGEG